MSERKRWWERLVDRLARRGATHRVGSDYRAATIEEPEWMPWYAKAIEWIGPRVDAGLRVLFTRRALYVAILVVTMATIGAMARLAYVHARETPDAVDHATVTGVYWHYVIRVRARANGLFSNWADELRPHAFNVRCHPEQRGTHSCDPHPCTRIDYRGRVRIRTCWDECPTYDDMCVYNAPVWDVVDVLEREGTDHQPQYPTGPTDILAAPWCVADNETLGAQVCREAGLTRIVRFSSGHRALSYSIVGDDKREQTERFNHFVENACWVGTISGETFTPVYECEKNPY